jgi:amino-acid N-acetyltransferase
MPSDIRIRSARPTDLSDVRRLLLDMQLPLEGVPENLLHFYVALHGNRTTGVAGLEFADGEAALLRSVAVDEQYRGLGLATRLVDKAIADAQAEGCNALYLLTTTAAQYFARRGFVVVERSAVPEPLRETAEFRGACPDSATLMFLDLRKIAIGAEPLPRSVS